ncbi:MAG: hypothetical protein WCB99_09920 [Candidatus Cybelea sp.]
MTVAVPGARRIYPVQISGTTGTVGGFVGPRHNINGVTVSLAKQSQQAKAISNR